MPSNDHIVTASEDNLRNIFHEELKTWMRTMPDEDAHLIAGRLAEGLYNSIVAPVIKRQRDENSIRILASDVEVTADSAGNSVGTLGKSEFDIVNFDQATGWIESAAEGRRVNIRARGGGGNDCAFDHIVSDCWATEITAGRGTQGQVFTSLTGCTFRVWSTITAMQTQVDADDVACTVLICPATYNETWTIAADSHSTTTYWGFGRGLSTAALTTVVGVLTMTNTGTPNTIEFHGIQFQGGIAFGASTGSTVWSASWYDCDCGAITVSSSNGGMSGTKFERSRITSITCTAPGLGSVSYLNTITIRDCDITGSINCWGAGVNIESWQILGNIIGGGVQLGYLGASVYLEIVGNTFSGSVNGANVSSLRLGNSAGVGATITGNHFTAGGSLTSTTIKLYEDAGRNWGIIISGNTFAGNTNGYLSGERTDGGVIANQEITRLGFFGNTFSVAGGAAVKAIGTNLAVVDFTFGPNAPDCMDYSSVTSSDITKGAFYTACTIPAGGKQPLFTTTGVVPAHAFVGPSHSGDDDYTLTPKVLGLGVGTGGADWYSDAGITGTAHIDGPIGHAVFGTGDPGKSISIDSVSQDAQLAVRMVVSQGAGLLFTGHGTLTSSVPWMNIARSRGSYASPSIVASSDDLGGLRFFGYDGATYQIAAQILAEVDAAAGAGDMPGRLVFSTTPDGAKAVVERMRITREGAITVVSIAAPATPASDSISIYGETGTDFLKAKDDNAAVYNLTHKHTVPCIVDGTVTNQKTVIGPMAQAGVVTASKAKTCDAVTIGATAWIGQAYLIPAANVDTDGGTTSIYTTAPSITNGHMVSTNDALTTTPLPFAAGDYFAFGTTQVGTSATMIEFGLTIRYT